MFKDDFVKKASQIEFGFFNAKEVQLKLPLEIAERLIGRPPIMVQWVDASKADNKCPVNITTAVGPATLRPRYL